MIVDFGVGTQQPRGRVTTSHPNAVPTPGLEGGVIFSFKVCACQHRVTLPCKSSLGVRAPNMSSPFRSVHPEYSIFFTQSSSYLELRIVGRKTTRVYLSTDEKPLLCYSTSPGSGIWRLSLRNLSTPASPFVIASPGYPVFSSSAQLFHFTKYRSSFIHVFLPRTFCVQELMSLLTILSTSQSKSPSMSSGSREGRLRVRLFEDPSPSKRQP